MGYKSVSENWKTEDIKLQIARGEIPGHSIVHQFGHDPVVAAANYTPITGGALFRTPQVSGATTLRVKAGGNAADTAAGAGAREITIVGLDATGAEVTETLATAGESASANTTNTFLRVSNVFVSKSGTYASQTAGSHVGAIVIENSAGTEDWVNIVITGFPRGESEIGVYTVPLGYTAYVLSLVVHVDSNQAAGVIMFHRNNILETAAPYAAMKIVLELGGAVSGDHVISPNIPIKFNELTDLGFMAKSAASTADVSVNFEMLLIANQ